MSQHPTSIIGILNSYTYILSYFDPTPLEKIKVTVAQRWKPTRVQQTIKNSRVHWILVFM